MKFSVIMPHNADSSQYPSEATVSLRKIYLPNRIRATYYSPALFADISRFQPDILHLFEEFSGLIAFQALFLNRLLGRKSRTMIYSAENICNNVNPLLKFPKNYVKRHSHLAFACSFGVKRTLEEEGYGKPIEVFPLGVNTEKFFRIPGGELKKQLQFDRCFVIGYVGRLLKIKGVSLLVELMPHLPEQTHLVMIGSGPEEHDLRGIVSQLQLNHRVHFLGDIPYEKLPQYMNCFDIGIVPSLTTSFWKEQFGRVLVELMSCEIPVIGSDSGSIPEVLGDVGYIFQEGRVEQLAALVKQLTESKEERRKAGKQGRERVIKNYSTDVMGACFAKMYTNLMRV